jgi:hypothetical protein
LGGSGVRKILNMERGANEFGILVSSPAKTFFLSGRFGIMNSLNEKVDTPSQSQSLVEGVDYYIENGYWVLTEHFLRKRGYCCGSGCRHCPYRSKKSR